MLEILGYVDNKEEDSFVFVGDYFMVLKRGYAFIEEAIAKLQSLTEENKAKMKKYAEDLAKFKQEKAERDEQKKRILEWTQQDRREA